MHYIRLTQITFVNIFVCLFLLNWEVTCVITIAVSYTHLDVYKRQR